VGVLVLQMPYISPPAESLRCYSPMAVRTTNFALFDLRENRLPATA
jgi:hypothetical protein